MEQVKGLMAAGASLAEAVRIGVGGNLNAWCAESKLPLPTVSATLNLRHRPTPELLDALTARLGGSPQAWIDLWFDQAKGQLEAAIHGPIHSESAT